MDKNSDRSEQEWRSEWATIAIGLSKIFSNGLWSRAFNKIQRLHLQPSAYVFRFAVLCFCQHPCRLRDVLLLYCNAIKYSVVSLLPAFWKAQAVEPSRPGVDQRVKFWLTCTRQDSAKKFLKSYSTRIVPLNSIQQAAQDAYRDSAV